MVMATMTLKIDDGAVKAPAQAMRLSVTAFQMAAQGTDDDAEGVAFEMVARSPDPIDHWFFGPEVHDLDGVTHAERIAVDWIHDPDLLIGYADEFETDDKRGLVLRGRITSLRDDDKASEIIGWARAGIPLEASIDFTPSAPGDTAVQVLYDDEIADVNGYELEGPATIFRRWPLRRVAICPSGADAQTETNLQAATSAGQEVSIAVMDREGDTMKKRAKDDSSAALSAEEITALQDQNAALTAENTQLKADATPAPAVPPVADPPPADDTRAEFKLFADAFGDNASCYFADGLSYEDASVKHMQALKVENETLRAAQSGGDTSSPDGGAPVAFNGAASDNDPTKLSAEDKTRITASCKLTGTDPEKVIAAREADLEKPA